ncbi:UNKNOWN [Stylonychia lemnae]|uniref:Uncharacterized protein n=1 Tax=Stylonychia lemnae TaxID=5949 RepID=A0A078ANH4_STYLE|nr:UNKNOWN [Stylonychia lemnae]|eukprot:CDW83471.1 UNKNOWN [Stylonychia lemnae]
MTQMEKTYDSFFSFTDQRKSYMKSNERSTLNTSYNLKLNKLRSTGIGSPTTMSIQGELNLINNQLYSSMTNKNSILRTSLGKKSLLDVQEPPLQSTQLTSIEDAQVQILITPEQILNRSKIQYFTNNLLRKTRSRWDHKYKNQLQQIQRKLQE